MKKISLYINEKLHIAKEVKTIKTDLSNVKAPFIYPDSKAFEIMRDYHTRHSKPERLVNSIKDNEKLVRRFAVAVNMKWDEAIDEFGKALVDRGIYKQEEVDKYIEVHYAKN